MDDSSQKMKGFCKKNNNKQQSEAIIYLFLKY